MEIAKRLIEPADGKKVVIVSRRADGSLFAYQDETWCGSVPLDNGPRMVAIYLYDDHTVKADVSEGYACPVAWFDTEAEAQAYIDKAKEGAPC